MHLLHEFVCYKFFRHREELLICLTIFMVLMVHNALAMFLLGYVHCCIRKRKNATLFSIWWCQANLSTIYFYQAFQTWWNLSIWKIHIKSFVYQNHLNLDNVLLWFFIPNILIFIIVLLCKVKKKNPMTPFEFMYALRAFFFKIVFS